MLWQMSLAKGWAAHMTFRPRVRRVLLEGKSKAYHIRPSRCAICDFKAEHLRHNCDREPSLNIAVPIRNTSREFAWLVTKKTINGHGIRPNTENDLSVNDLITHMRKERSCPRPQSYSGLQCQRETGILRIMGTCSGACSQMLR